MIMKELAQRITSDKEFTNNAYLHYKKQLDDEMAKPVKKRDYKKIASLTENMCALVDGGNVTEEVDEGINKLYNRISDYENSKRKPTVRVFRKMIPAICVASVMLIANCITVSALGKNIFSVVIEFTQSGFSVDFNSKQSDIIELPISENDPYGIITECAKYEIYPETPFYLPEGYILSLTTHNVSDYANYVKFVFRNGEKSVTLTYTQYWDDMPQVGIPSDDYNIS